jgi:hypothetical protein
MAGLNDAQVAVRLAVPYALTCLGCFSSKLPQNRHPERSASQSYCVTQRLWRGVEGPRRCLSYPCRSDLFNHQSPHRRFRHGLPPGPRIKNLLHSRQPYRPLYIGVTSKLYQRVMQHKEGTLEGKIYP